LYFRAFTLPYPIRHKSRIIKLIKTL